MFNPFPFTWQKFILVLAVVIVFIILSVVLTPVCGFDPSLAEQPSCSSTAAVIFFAFAMAGAALLLAMIVERVVRVFRKKN